MCRRATQQVQVRKGTMHLYRSSEGALCLRLSGSVLDFMRLLVSEAQLTCPQLVNQCLQRVQVRGLLRLRIKIVRANAARNTTPMKCEFARELIEASARSPAFNARLRQGVER